MPIPEPIPTPTKVTRPNSPVNTSQPLSLLFIWRLSLVDVVGGTADPVLLGPLVAVDHRSNGNEQQKPAQKVCAICHCVFHIGKCEVTGDSCQIFVEKNYEKFLVWIRLCCFPTSGTGTGLQTLFRYLTLNLVI